MSKFIIIRLCTFYLCLIRIINVLCIVLQVGNLRDIIGNAINYPEDKVIAKMNAFCKSDVTNIILQNNVELAKTTYNRAKEFPSSETIAAMKMHGISILEECANNPNALIIYGFKDVSPVALKKIGDVERERLLDLCSANLSHSYIISFEFIESNFICMPRLVTTLVHMSPLNDVRQRALWICMSSALDYLHRNNYAHMDIKPDNIGLKEGKLVLIDLGSTSKFGEYTTVTDEFVPKELKKNRTFSAGQLASSANTDWWMLAMTFCYKMDRSLYGRKTNLKKSDIIRILSDSENSNAQKSMEESKKEMYTEEKIYLNEVIWKEFSLILDDSYVTPTTPFISSLSSSSTSSVV